MQLMRAVTLKGFGEVDMLQLSNIPKVAITKATDVLIKVVAAGINRADITQRRGHYPPPAGASEVLGLEVSGVVERVGQGVTGLKEGDRVMALVPGGGYAEYVIAHCGSVMPVPQGISMTEAAAIPEAFLTAWQALKKHADLKAGQRVLIHAGASGVGTAASQLAEKYFKATAITTCSESKLEVCKNYASVNLDRTPDDTGLCFSSKVKHLLGEDAINVVIDPIIGGTYLAEDASVLAEDGCIIALSVLGGSHVQLNCLPLFRRRAKLIFSALRSQSDAYKADLVGSFSKEIIPYMKERIIVPVLNQTFKLEEVAQAHLSVEANKLWGKTVLTVVDPRNL